MNLSKYGPGDEITWGSYTGGANDPRNDDEDDDTLMHPDTAHELATDEFVTTAESVADWLAKVTDTPAGREPVDTEKIDEADIFNAKPHILLALIFNGTNAQAQAARHELRYAFLKAHQGDIDTRANELLEQANGKPERVELANCPY